MSSTFTDIALQYYTIGVTIVWLGLVRPVPPTLPLGFLSYPSSEQYTPLGFFDVSAQLIGVEPTKSFYTIVTANAASGVGRLTSGYWADSFGSLNVLILFSFVASVTAFAWPYVPAPYSIIDSSYLFLVLLDMLTPSPRYSWLPPSSGMYPFHLLRSTSMLISGYRSVSAVVHSSASWHQSSVTWSRGSRWDALSVYQAV